MSEPIPTDVVVDGLGRMLSQWEDKPNITGLVQSYLENIQVVEDMWFQLLTERDIYSAVGAQLDVLGLIVGQLRLGQEDELYRQSILNRVAINTSDSTPEKILEILKLITNTDTVGLWEHYPASLHLFTDGTLTNTTATALSDSAAAGVSVRLMFHNSECPSFIPSSLIGDTFDFVDNTNDQLEDDLLDPFIVNGYSEGAVAGNRSHLPNLGELSCVNPLCNVITSDPLVVSVDDLLDDTLDPLIFDVTNGSEPIQVISVEE
jgi:hypothetical protein